MATERFRGEVFLGGEILRFVSIRSSRCSLGNSEWDSFFVISSLIETSSFTFLPPAFASAFPVVGRGVDRGGMVTGISFTTFLAHVR
eukprot:1147289-Heterocapsa_arctica.AAC.1